MGHCPLLHLLSWCIDLFFFAPRFQNLGKLQRVMSDLFPWPFLKRLPLLDTVLRNVVAQDLHFVQGELALLSFVTHWAWASETVTRKWAYMSLPDVLMKFWAEFCWCVIYTYLLLQRPQERFTENMPGCCHNEGHTVQQSLLCGLGQAISWGWFNFFTDTCPMVLDGNAPRTLHKGIGTSACLPSLLFRACVGSRSF